MIGYQMIMTNKFIEDSLNELYPNASCELKYTKDYELLLSTMLSAQTTDKRVNSVMIPIYKEYNTLEKLSTLSLSEVTQKLMTLGFYKAKALYFIKIVKVLSSGPYDLSRRQFLESLSGVGRKTANVILNEIYNEPFIAVDTHVKRVSKILGIAEDKDNEKVIEEKLMKFFLTCNTNKIGKQLVLFGRYTCTSNKPNCKDCPFNNKCKKFINK